MLIVSCVIATIYYTYVFVVFGPQLEESKSRPDQRVPDNANTSLTIFILNFRGYFSRKTGWNFGPPVLFPPVLHHACVVLHPVDVD